MSMWALWAATEVEPHALPVVMHRVCKAAGRARSQDRGRRHRGPARAVRRVLDRRWPQSGFIVGGRFTVADINAAEVFRYAMPAPELPEAAPRVKARLAAATPGPAFKAMMGDSGEGAGVAVY